MHKNIRNSFLQKIFLFFFLFFFLMLPQNAFAYLDLYTGSYLLQLLLGGLLGFLYAIKLYWKTIKTFCIKIFSKNKEPGRHEK
jgi:hypothetical protein